MKLDWIKYNLLPALFGMIFLVAIGYGAWGWFKASSQNRELASALQSQEERITQLTQMRAREVFPSPQNLVLIRNERNQLETLYTKLESVAVKSVEVPMLNPVQFASRLAQTLKRMALAAHSKDVLLPDRFTFGFSDINRLAPAPEVPGLTKQLIVTEALCANLFGCGIRSLATLQAEPSNSATNSLYRRTPFTLKFTCSTTALQEFLNRLQKMEWLFSVRSMEIEAKTSIPQAAGGAPAGMPMGPGGVFGPGAFPPGIPMPAPPPGRTTGRTTQTPPGADANAPTMKPAPLEPPQTVLTVTMRVDLLEFAKPSTKSPKST